MSREKDQLFEELTALEQQILEKLESLINASWDSNTLKIEISRLMSDRENIFGELYRLDNRKD